MTIDFWDNRYSAEEYVFGKEPNDFFKNKIDTLEPGKILVLAAGEGRDAVYAAKKGWEVLALDQSEKGKEKALKLSKEQNVTIEFQVCDILEIENFSYDVIALIFFHLPSETRKRLYQKIVNGMRKGGMIILESFNPEQLNNNSGGPKDIDMLLTKEIIEKEFYGLSVIENNEEEIILNEGKGHVGKANVVRFVAVKE